MAYEWMKMGGFEWFIRAMRRWKNEEMKVVFASHEWNESGTEWIKYWNDYSIFWVHLSKFLEFLEAREEKWKKNQEYFGSLKKSLDTIQEKKSRKSFLRKNVPENFFSKRLKKFRGNKNSQKRFPKKVPPKIS